METLLRAALVRFNVSAKALTRVLQVTNTLYRKSNTGIASARDPSQFNPMANIMLEILSEALRGKARVTGSTLAGLIEVEYFLFVS